MKNKLILIKLGGSLITDKNKPFTANHQNIIKLVKYVKRHFLKQGDVVLSHGGGSFPHTPASKYKTHLGLINGIYSLKGFCLTSQAAMMINAIVLDEFIKDKCLAVSFSPRSMFFDNESQLKHILKALDLGLLPILYGDTIMDSKMGFKIYSGEVVIDKILSKIYKEYKQIAVYYFVDTKGVYDDAGKTIPEINKQNFKKIKDQIKGSQATDVTGGMLHKVSEALEISSKFDAEVYIMNPLVSSLKTRIYSS